jgi:RNA polymerase-interacting CarD/CdnL/TRCF family regulator
MVYKIGDKVIHWTYGLGEIVDVEEKNINGQLKKCYVVQITNMKIWTPIDDQEQHCLRVPTSPDGFMRLFSILTSPSEKLAEDRVQRKNLLMAQLKDGQLASICRVVRDLTHFKRIAKLSDQERSILERAVTTLLTEWSFSLGIPLDQAQQEMAHLLDVNVSPMVAEPG